ncbi:uncharacterized protein [Panulirus ornatus]|uniref:uncharacterized protein n=1 Tax=Panulirus ornatus TaxID=150431 RepID=UPI003A858008
MNRFRGSQFVVSSAGILKVAQMMVLVTGLVMFLAGNKCGNTSSFVTLYVLPVGVCAGVTLVSYVSAILVLLEGRNPLAIPTWVKGEVVFNTVALAVTLTGSAFTLTNEGCADQPLTVAAIALGFISAILYASSSAVAYLQLLHHQKEQKEAQLATIHNRRVTCTQLA